MPRSLSVPSVCDDHRLAPLLTPRSVALVGASPRNGSVGNAAAKALRRSGFTGDISFVPNTPLAAEISARIDDNLVITWADAGSADNQRRYVAWSTTSQAAAGDLSGYAQSGITYADDITIDVGSAAQVFFRVVSLDAGGNRLPHGSYRIEAEVHRGTEVSSGAMFTVVDVESVTLGAGGQDLTLSVSGLGDIDMSQVRKIM